MHWEKQLLQVVGFGSIQSGKTFENSCEKGAVTKGSIQGLIIESRMVEYLVEVRVWGRG
jgi:hypothetical protein